MVKKAHGKHRRTRDKLRKTTRITVNQYMKKFDIGDRVALNIESASAKSMPFRRFQGLTGKIVGERGKSYFVEIKDSGKTKKVLTKPEHLKVVK